MNPRRSPATSAEAAMRNPVFARLRDLGLPRHEFIIAGSAPLVVRGLKERIADLDVVVRGSAWATARGLGAVTTASYHECRAVHLFGGAIEILDGWFPRWFPQDDLFDRAEDISGMNFMRVEDTLEWKRRLGRQKDIADIARACGLEKCPGRPRGGEVTRSGRAPGWRRW